LTINVTKTYLPPMEDYIHYLERIWASGWITNHGQLVQELETKLAAYLRVPYVEYVSNGTMALQLALRALDIHGEVITTPFSYVATTNSIIWENCTPVFVDIEPDRFCIDPEKIEAAITDETKAIRAVHVYGYACDVERIEAIAKKHNLKVIYDAAHAFGCKLEGISLLNYGDLSTLSFHATKVFHTVEGGAIVAQTKDMAEKLSLLRAFGHIADDYYLAGINGKNTEIHAAMGLCVLPHVAENMQKRRIIYSAYTAGLEGSGIKLPRIPAGLEYNYAYYPVLLNDEKHLLSVMKTLNENKINPRRYFYPSLNTLPFYGKIQPCIISENMSLRILCLPLYESLDLKSVEEIIDLVRNA
jgi:dTDP-4-amino-4,6-dideoxygalactose transaminase